jgi:hypothetical protein
MQRNLISYYYCNFWIIAVWALNSKFPLEMIMICWEFDLAQIINVTYISIAGFLKCHHAKKYTYTINANISVVRKAVSVVMAKLVPGV